MGEKLRNELDDDPLARAYADMTKHEAADDFNTIYREVNVNSLTGDQCFQATDPTEFANLSDHKQDLWLSFCGRNSIDPWASENEAFVKWIFGDTSTTVSNLGSMRTQMVSRAEELGLGDVTTGDVERTGVL